MIEWWQAVLIAGTASTFTGLFAWVISYSQSLMAADAARKSDERHAANRLAEELRNVRRDQRRKRIEPFYVILKLTGERLAANAAKKALQEAYEDNLLGAKQKYKTREDFESAMAETIVAPTFVEMGRAMRAVLACTDDRQLLDLFGAVIDGMIPDADLVESYRVMRAMENALELYIVG